MAKGLRFKMLYRVNEKDVKQSEPSNKTDTVKDFKGVLDSLEPGEIALIKIKRFK